MNYLKKTLITLCLLFTFVSGHSQYTLHYAVNTNSELGFYALTNSASNQAGSVSNQTLIDLIHTFNLNFHDRLGRCGVDGFLIGLQPVGVNVGAFFLCYFQRKHYYLTTAGHMQKSQYLSNGSIPD